MAIKQERAFLQRLAAHTVVLAADTKQQPKSKDIDNLAAYVAKAPSGYSKKSVYQHFQKQGWTLNRIDAAAYKARTKRLIALKTINLYHYYKYIPIMDR